MSTITSSEYGDRSGAELLKMSRSEIGSGEIDVNVVLPSGSKRERKQAAMANVQPFAKLAPGDDEKRAEEVASPVVMPSPTAFSERLQSSAEARRKRKELADKERARLRGESHGGGVGEMLALMQRQMSEQQEQNRLFMQMVSDKVDRLEGGSSPRLGGRAEAVRELAQAAGVLASPASLANLPATELDFVKEDLAPGLGQVLDGPRVKGAPGEEYVFLRDAMDQIKHVEGEFERVYRLKKERIPRLGDRSSKEIRFLTALADMVMGGEPREKVANELIRRTQALLLAETHNDWGYADVMENDRPKEIVRPHLLNAVQRDRERLKKLQGTSSGASASGDAALKRKIAALEKKVTDQSKQLNVHEKFRREANQAKKFTPGGGRGGAK